MYKIYYDDAFILEGDVNFNIPQDRRTGVIAVAIVDKTHNWVFWHSKDWYILQHDGEWFGCDQSGLIDQIVHRCEHLKYVLQGRILVPYEKFEIIINKMLAECKPEKTGWYPGEK